MSTKSTLVSGRTFHLYEEALDPAQNVWLALDGCEFEASSRGVRVEIPLPVWEVLRQHTPARFDLAPLDDKQLLAEAEKRVENVRAEYREDRARERADRGAGKLKRGGKSITRFFYRMATLPQAQHLESVLAALREDRTKQRSLLRAIARLSPPTATGSTLTTPPTSSPT